MLNEMCGSVFLNLWAVGRSEPVAFFLLNTEIPLIYVINVAYRYVIRLFYPHSTQGT